MILSKTGRLNFCRKKRYPAGVLLTTDFGTWEYLTNEEYKTLVSGDIDKSLFRRLEIKGIILTEENKERISQKYSDYQKGMLSGTSLHIIVPTIRCNQTCIYCYALRRLPSTKGVDMDQKTAKEVVDFIFQTPNKCITIEFTGGEPLLNFPIVKYIIEYSMKLNKKFKKEVLYAVVTNGTMLNEDILKFLKNKNIGICISLDGPKLLHDKQRKYVGGKPTYDDATYWIRRLKADKTYWHRVNLLPVVTKNTLGYWKELVDEYVNLGIEVLRLKYAACFGFAAKAWGKMGYTAEGYLEFWKNSINYMLELNRKGIFIRDGIASILLIKILTGENPCFSELNAPCGAVTGQMVYNYNGDVYPCDESRIFSEFKIGNVKSNTYREVISHPTSCSIINMSSNLSLLCDNCPWFSFCGNCPMQAYSMQNTIVTKLPFDIKCKMHKEMIDFLFEKVLFHPEDAKIFKKWVNKENPG